jgi:hypothetical protein
MQFWLHEVIAPQSILRNIGFALLVVASGMSSMLLLRIAALAAGFVFIVIFSIVAYDPVGLFWMVFFVLMNGYHLFMLRSRKFGRPLDEEQEHFRRAVVPELHPGQVRRLLTVGKWVTADDRRALTRQDQPVRNLIFIHKGRVDIIVDGAKVAEVGPGELVGEIGISTGEASTATAVCRGPVRLLEFKAEPLYRLLDSHKDLLEAIEGAVQRSLREKLRRTNATVARSEAD